MNLPRIALALLVMATLAPAQRVERINSRVFIPEALQEALGLDETQIEQLTTNSSLMREAIHPLRQTASRDQQDLQRELRSDRPNETIVGALVLAIEQARTEIADLTASYREHALEFLTPDQIAALEPISNAAASWNVIREAASYNLIRLPQSDEADASGRAFSAGLSRFGRLIAVPDALQATLGLDESQLSQLRSIDFAMNEAMRPLTRRLAQAHRDLRRALNSETPNETIVGALQLSVQQIGNEMEVAAETYHAQARWVLSEDQIVALVAIEEAAALWNAVRQAAALNLVDIPDSSNAVPGVTGGGGSDGRGNNNNNNRGRGR